MIDNFCVILDLLQDSSPTGAIGVSICEYKWIFTGIMRYIVHGAYWSKYQFYNVYEIIMSIQNQPVK